MFAAFAALFALPVSSANAGVLLVAVEPVEPVPDGGSANAGVLSSLLTFNGVEDLLIDQSRSNFTDADGSGGFSVGDVLSGFVTIDQADPDSDSVDIVDVNSPEAVVFAFAAEVTGENENGSLNLGVSTVEGNTLEDFIDADIYSNVNNAAETIFVALEASAAASSPLDESVFDSLDDFNADNGFSFVLSGGIAAGTDDFFQFSPIGIGDIVGAEAGGFTIFDSPFGVDALLPVSTTRLDDLADSQHDVSLINGTIFNADPGSVFDFANNSDFAINVVPEPTTMMSFIGIFGLVTMRRRK